VVDKGRRGWRAAVRVWQGACGGCVCPELSMVVCVLSCACGAGCHPCLTAPVLTRSRFASGAACPDCLGAVLGYRGCLWSIWVAARRWWRVVRTPALVCVVAPRRGQVVPRPCWQLPCPQRSLVVVGEAGRVLSSDVRPGAQFYGVGCRSRPSTLQPSTFPV